MLLQQVGRRRLFPFAAYCRCGESAWGALLSQEAAEKVEAVFWQRHTKQGCGPTSPAMCEHARYYNSLQRAREAR